MANVRGAPVVITVVLAAVEVVLVAASGIAINSATSDPARWPAFLDWVPVTPAWGLAIAVTAAVAVAVGMAVRGIVKSEPQPATAPRGITITASDDSPVNITGSVMVRHLEQTNVSMQLEIPVPASAPAVSGLHNLPPASAVFVGRDIEAVDRTFDEHVGIIGQTVHGLGGVGKTELALHYAHHRAGQYPLRWWIIADKADNITLGLAQFTARLHPMPSLADARAWAIAYLQTHPGWLLILDNVEDPEHIADLTGQLAKHGRILITTRRDLGHARWTKLGLAPLRLGVLSRQASLDLLARLTGDLFESGSADQLAEALGDLPLALEQAAAYITNNPTHGMHGYLRLLAGNPAALRGEPSPGASPDRAVAQVWNTTMAAINQQNPLAGQVLSLLAYLAPDNVPEEVLAPIADESGRNSTLGVLASYSMITRHRGKVSVHRLVQAVTRDAGPVAKDQIPPALTTAIAGISLLMPVDPVANVAGWPIWRALLAHIDAAAGYLPRHHQNAAAIALIEDAALFRLGQGQLSTAIIGLEQVLADRQRLLGDRHINTLGSRLNLAIAYRLAGRLGEAITMNEEVLARLRRRFGANDTHTLAARHNLAFAYRLAGRLGEAIVLYEQVVADRRRVLGDDGPETLASRHSLASAYRLAGRLGEAIVLYEQVVADRQRVLGDDHPDTLTTWRSLAIAYRLAGRLDDAIALHEQVVADRQRVLGEDHPDTLLSRQSLAITYEAAGRHGEAAVLFEEVLADRRRVLGDDHPDVLDSQASAQRAHRRPPDHDSASRSDQ